MRGRKKTTDGEKRGGRNKRGEGQGKRGEMKERGKEKGEEKADERKVRGNWNGKIETRPEKEERRGRRKKK